MKCFNLLACDWTTCLCSFSITCLDVPPWHITATFLQFGAGQNSPHSPLPQFMSPPLPPCTPFCFVIWQLGGSRWVQNDPMVGIICQPGKTNSVNFLLGAKRREVRTHFLKWSDCMCPNLHQPNEISTAPFVGFFCYSAIIRPKHRPSTCITSLSLQHSNTLSSHLISSHHSLCVSLSLSHFCGSVTNVCAHSLTLTLAISLYLTHSLTLLSRPLIWHLTPLKLTLALTHSLARIPLLFSPIASYSSHTHSCNLSLLWPSLLSPLTPPSLTHITSHS
jgi:hypothetical protein